MVIYFYFSSLLSSDNCLVVQSDSVVKQDHPNSLLYVQGKTRCSHYFRVIAKKLSFQERYSALLEYK